MKVLEVFTFTDQPTTCPKCGSRTKITLDLFNSSEKTQYHQCLSNECDFKFIIEDENGK